MEDSVEQLKEEIERVRSQLYIFYELTKAMRTTLRLDEIVYIILTGLTAQEGLAFNRAIILLADEHNAKINGFMGIGPMNHNEADSIWCHIKDEKKNLDALIHEYNNLRKTENKPKFTKFIESLSFDLSKENDLAFKILNDKQSLHIKNEISKKFADDPLIEKLELNEFIAASLWIKDHPKGIIIVDNYVTGKKITDEDINIFNMFADQAQGAIENSQEFEYILNKSHTDSLTGLWNHGYFQYKLDEEFVNACNKDLPLSVMMIDVDDFKKFNDTYGHMQGDNALREIAATIKENCRKIDVLCRYGGEEFSLILPSTKKKEAHHLAERIRQSVQNKKALKLDLTISVGVASFPQDASTKESFVKKADESLYQAKREGKNRVIVAG